MGSGPIIPVEVSRRVAKALRRGDVGDAIIDATRVGGGCVHPAARVRTTSGQVAFLKWGSSPGEAGFDVEAAGLSALSLAGGPRTPKVLGYDPGGPGVRGWILLEYVDQGHATPETATSLGRGLARLHRRLPKSRPGWEQDGYIGPLKQRNAVHDREWPGFWREARLQRQWELAASGFDRAFHKSWDQLMERVELALLGWESDGISLLHGDLWSGNVITAADGEPVLVDPAIYRGHREVDLAMMELFGGFNARVFEEYGRDAPFQEGYAERRRDLYQLYPLLVHVNLFGSSYVAPVQERVRRLLGKLK